MAEQKLLRENHKDLLEHLAWVKEEKEHVLETYYSNEVEKRNELRNFLSDYIQHIEDFIEKINTDETFETCLPFSIIGGVVEVEDMGSDERIAFHIISPFTSNQEISEYENPASYLSPIGKALLLKVPGDQVIIKTPSMIHEYRVKSFRFP